MTKKRQRKAAPRGKALDKAISVFIFGHDLAIKAGMHKDCSLSAAHAREARRDRVQVRSAVEEGRPG
jgi:hypothetical protein